MVRNRPIYSINITPLADVTTTLIVIFLMTMPYILWSGIKVNATKAVKDREVVQVMETTGPVMVVITSEAVVVNKRPIASIGDLYSLMSQEIEKSSDKTALIIPDGDVLLGRVVDVLDVAKQCGAERLALLKKKGESVAMH